MKSVAVVGSGIAGMAAAWLLSRRYRVTLFEKDDRIGGHTHTVPVAAPEGTLPVDTGFIVFNEHTYPGLTRLFRELGVETQESDMSFGVSCARTGFEYSSRGLRGWLAAPMHHLRPAPYRMLKDLLRFNRTAAKLLDQDSASLDASTAITLAEYLDRERFAEEFRRYYLYPMAAAVWSTPAGKMQQFPAATLIRFFRNHGFLGIDTHFRWRIVRGGSSRYIAPLTAPYRERVVTSARLRRVRRLPQAVQIEREGCPAESFDEVVFACHGNQILPLLADATEPEREILGSFDTTPNRVTLHTDGRVLPRRAAARASWNYQLRGDDGAVTMTYHMNRLQGLRAAEDYCVTLNGDGGIDPARVLRQLEYRHPLFTSASVRAQQRWAEISGQGRTHFCGAYWFYGFHEDGLQSALRVAQALGVEW